MKKFQTKFAGVIIAVLLMTFMFPVKALGANTDLQIVKTDNGDYIIYIKDLQNEEFEYTVTQSSNTQEIDLNYENCKKDDAGNSVVFITSGDYVAEQDYYLYVRENGETLIQGQKLDFSTAFTQQQMRDVENTTKRIETELVTDLVEQDEEIDGVRVTVTVGGLKIVEQEGSKYYYTTVKLPSTEYNILKELAEKINNEYETMDMYSKIELAKEFNETYNNLINNQEWQEVQNLTIMQPNDAQKDEQYIVFIKQVDENQNETTDLKIMTSYREDEEEKIPGRTETTVVKETTKLPITGDSIILFVILATIIIVAIIVFVRMKKLQNKDEEK